ncbi:MAG: ABC transporter substrate-binding protein [Candidatus Vecturithrix sp.]|jgi:peptide/nickel transport system substrate-binding protein|nr:ABC transporter substrate-binding protein [Candidatus Vecturithrix sp.]
MKKLGSILCCFILLIGITAFAEVKNPDTFIKVVYNTIRTLDPAVTYDTTSAQRVENVYESLIRFDGAHTDKFVPFLATEVPSIENGGISADGKTYTFTIRKGVKFHEGGDLTPEDVEYSFERHMILDPDGGPMWMMLEALTGEGTTRDADGSFNPEIVEKIMNSVEVDGDKVLLHLPKPYPPLLGILTKNWASIIDKEWAMEHGCWDGKAETAAQFNNPPAGQEPLFEITNGTGAYKMKNWEKSKEFVFERFEDYWGPKPALKYAIIKTVAEWSTRKLMLLNGDADYVSVQEQYVAEMANLPGIVQVNVPQLAIGTVTFTQKVNLTANPNIGSGQLDGEGIPPDFFSDLNVRKAFMHAFDRDTFTEDILQGVSFVPTSIVIEGLPYHIEAPYYEFDLEKAAEYMKKAWDGQVWEKGFKMAITHNTGNLLRESIAIMLAENIMSLNPKFQIEVRGVDWRDYLVAAREMMYPVWVLGWTADYPDPHNFTYTYMHSNGYYGSKSAYSNPEVDQLVDAGISEPDPVKRAEIYEKLQHLWYEEAIGLLISQTTVVRHYRDWVKGYVLNSMDDDAAEWLYQLRKEEVQ